MFIHKILNENEIILSEKLFSGKYELLTTRTPSFQQFGNANLAEN